MRASFTNGASFDLDAYASHSSNARPPTSSVNVESAGSTRASLVTVPVGSDGGVMLYTNAGTHLVADVAGYFTSETSSRDGRFVGQAPTRLLDTRPTSLVGYSGAKPGVGSTVSMTVAGRAGVPSTGAPAVVLNVTATEASAPGFVTVWPGGAARPNASNINLEAAGQTRPNQVIVPLGRNGTVQLFVQNGAHLVVDVAGYFTDGAAGVSGSGLFIPATPIRILDTRPESAVGYSGSRPGPGAVVSVPAGAIGGGVVLTATMTQSAAAGFVTVWPSGGGLPVASNLNADGPGRTSSNHVISAAGAGGSISLYTSAGSDLIVDLTGRFRP